MLNDDIERFKNRECKAKDIFELETISKDVAYSFVRQYHYLGDAKFFCCKAVGLFYKPTHQLVGCATYQCPQGISALKSWFNLGNDTKNIWELGRLCLLPSLNKTNATSYLLNGSIRLINQENQTIKEERKRLGLPFEKDDWVCRAIITLATSDRHVGSIYQVCNFTYYGLTKPASDFYREDGAINPRGASGSFLGVYLNRARKHRYAYILDKTLKCNYKEEPKPKQNDLLPKQCCGGTKKVYDDRFNRTYTCPICCGYLKRIDDGKENDEAIDRLKEKNIQEQTSLF